MAKKFTPKGCDSLVTDSKRGLRVHIYTFVKSIKIVRKPEKNGWPFTAGQRAPMEAPLRPQGNHNWPFLPV